MSAVRDRSTGQAARPAVSLTKPVVASPTRIVAGGLVWQAELDGKGTGAWLGWAVAVRLGKAGPADRGRE